MPILQRYDARTDSLVPIELDNLVLGRYDPSSTSESESGSEHLSCIPTLCELLGFSHLLSSAPRYEDDSASSMSSSGTDASSEEDDCLPVGERGKVSLTLQKLQSMHAVATEINKEASCHYAIHGRCKTRIVESIRKPVCACKCRLQVAQLFKLCMAFWCLTKRGQDTVLWEIQQHGTAGRKKDWYLEGLVEPLLFNMIELFNEDNVCDCVWGPQKPSGEHVCKEGWMHMMAIGRKRLARTRQIAYGKDLRCYGGIFADFKGAP